jgi:hypothetical protein
VPWMARLCAGRPILKKGDLGGKPTSARWSARCALSATPSVHAWDEDELRPIGMHPPLRATLRALGPTRPRPHAEGRVTRSV